MFNLEDLVADLSNSSDFDERPVDLDTFMGEGYLEQTGVELSYYQKEMIEHMTQIYRYDTLVELYGQKEAKRRFKKTVREVVVCVGKGCQAPDTPTYNPKTGRWQRLDEFKDARTGSALGLMADNGFASTYATEAFFEGHGQMVRVTTQSGVSEDVYVGHKYLAMKKHKFYKRVRDESRPEYIQVKDLSVGDRIAMAMDYPCENEVSIGEDTAWVLGMLIGDGCMPQQYASGNVKTASIDFHSQEIESLGKFIGILTEHGDAISTTVKHKNKKMVTLHLSKKHAPWVMGLINEHGLNGKNVYAKSVPDALWTCPKSEVAAFVGGLFMSDGSVWWKPNGTKNKQPMIEFSSSSRAGLSADVQKLMWKIGVPARLRTKYPKYTYKGELKHGFPAHTLEFGGGDRIMAFANSIEMYDHKARILKEFMERYADEDRRWFSRMSDSVYYDQIKSIEPLGEDEYWTMTQPETHNYVGNGFVSMNSGKDYMAEIACAFIVHKLLCLKDPAKYFGKPPGDSIDIVNVAVNADQARNVFFKGLTRMVTKSPWFMGKYSARQRDISFDKNITIYSGHSEAEAFEGYNLFFCVLDEIAGFEHIPKGEDDSGVTPAQAIYDMYNASITSRFGDSGKLVLLSFPRRKGDFIQSRYEEVVGEVVHHPYSHTFVLNSKMPVDAPGNSFDIEWTEDEIISYRHERIWALRRPSWKVNPTKDIEEYKQDFFSDSAKALGKFAAEPQISTGGFFDEHDLIDSFSNYRNGWVDGRFAENFKPDEDAHYFIHVDLARKHDRCVVSMAHVTGWKRVGMQGGDEEIVPEIKVDLIRYWTPEGSNHVNFTEVREFVMTIIRRGFNVKKVTLDQWESSEIIKYFNRAGIESDVLSVGLAQYMDLKIIISESRAEAPYDEVLRRELKQLYITKTGKNVDHPKTKHGSKDISDSVCGAIYNAARLTPKEDNFEFKIYDELDFAAKQQQRVEPLINPPKKQEMPADLAKFLDLI